MKSNHEVNFQVEQVCVVYRNLVQGCWGALVRVRKYNARFASWWKKCEETEHESVYLKHHSPRTAASPFCIQ